MIKDGHRTKCNRKERNVEVNDFYIVKGKYVKI